MASFDDNFSHQASEYARYRPVYPDELYAWIASIVPKAHRAWDAGTGNGQAALGLARHFDRVVATDPSSAQIALATPHEHVEYMIATAEDTSIPTASIDAATAASAVHWFDLDRYFAEVRRVLRPGGVIVVWCYQRTTIEPSIDTIVQTLSRETLGPYWSPKIKLVNEHYRTLPFPFEEIEAPPFAIEMSWSADEMLGYLRSWSSTQAFIRAEGYDPLDAIAEPMREAWGAPGAKRNVRWNLYVRAGRV